MVLEMPVKREKRGVIFIGLQRALLKINRENGDAPVFVTLRFFAAGKREHLGELPAVFLAVIFIGQQRIKKIILAGFNSRIGVVGKKRRQRPGFFRVLLLIVKKRPGSFGAVPGIQRQRKFVEQRPGVKNYFPPAGGQK